jgi:hypothetical protein
MLFHSLFVFKYVFLKKSLKKKRVQEILILKSLLLNVLLYF